jgi:hypothetical protein
MTEPARPKASIGLVVLVLAGALAAVVLVLWLLIQAYALLGPL